jgi:hypothetical protein
METLLGMIFIVSTILILLIVYEPETNEIILIEKSTRDVAVSSVLLEMGWTPGKKVWIEGYGVFVITLKKHEDFK